MFVHLNCIFCAVFVTLISKGNNGKQPVKFQKLVIFFVM